MNSAQILPAVRDLYSRHPEMHGLEPWELQSALFLLGYTNDLVDEAEIRCGRGGGAGGLATMEGSMTNRHDERDAERQELEAAGWESKGRGAKTIWRSPGDGSWYAHYQAVTMLSKEGPNPEEARLLDEQGFERVRSDGTLDGRERWSRVEEGSRLYTRSKALEKARRETL